MPIALKRACERPSSADGTRILVERLWPRGVSKQSAAIDHWIKDAAPSTELRKWFDHDPAKWDEFVRRYREELDAKLEVLDPIRSCMRLGAVTFVFGAKEVRFNNAVALKQVLEELENA